MKYQNTFMFRLSEKQTLGLLLFVALFVRVSTVIALDIQPVSDYAGYRNMAINLLAGKGLSDGSNLAFLSAGYPLFVLAPIFYIFGDSLLSAQLMNAILGTLSTALVYLIARDAGAGKVGRLMAVGLFSLYLPSWIYAEYLAKENLMTPLMLGVVFLSIKSLHQPSVSIYIAIGGLFGILAITGNAGLAILSMVFGALILSRVSFRSAIVNMAVIGISAGLIVSPWLFRNYQVIGSPVLNSNAGFNLYIGNNPAANGYFVSIVDTPRGATWHQLRAQGEMEASVTLKVEALDWIKRNPDQFAMLAVKKAGIFWLPPVHQGQGSQSKFEKITRLAWLIQYLLVFCLAVFSIFIKKLRTNETCLVWLAILGYASVHMVFYVIFRYREPIMPLLVVLAGMSIEHLSRMMAWKRVKDCLNNSNPSVLPHSSSSPSRF
jgi:hypothetical protein